MVQRFPKPMGLRSEFPYSYYKVLQDHSKTLETVFAETEWHEHFRLTEPEPAEALVVDGVTPAFFAALGARPLKGRTLIGEDATRQFDRPPAVLSYDFWNRRFGGDAGAVGKTLAINGHRFLVVGVMQQGFEGLSVDNGPDIRIPLQAYSILTPEFKMDHAIFAVAGRLRPGVTPAQAQAECLALWGPVMKAYYPNVDRMAPQSVTQLINRMEVQSLERGTSILRDNFGDVLKLLMACVVLLVLIVALNVAGLLLARAAARQREMAVRIAIGGTAWRIARQLFAESILLAGLGAIGGWLVALVMTPLAIRSLPPVRDMYTAIVPISLHAGINWHVFLFLLASSVATAVVFTVSPLFATLRLSTDQVLRTARSSGNFRGRQLLIAAQIALCTFLLAGAGLLVHSFERLRTTPSGIAIDSVATFRCDTGTAKFTPGAVDAVLERICEIPGVTSVSTASSGVLRGHGLFMIAVPAGQRVTRADFLSANANSVSRDYFTTMGMRLVAGRNFLPGEVAQPKQKTPVKAVVNEAFVRKLFPGSSGIGKRFGTAVEGSIAAADNEIVGVVSDAKYRSLRDPIRPMAYRLMESVDSDFILNVRTRVAPETIIQPVREALTSVAPDLTLLETETLSEAADESTAPERVTATLASLFGAMATLLAGIGTYGLLAYAVTQRRREIGIHMALGAQPVHVAKLIGAQTFAMAASGISAGLGAALVAGRFIRSLLYGISPQDPTALAGAGAFVVLIAFAATIGPVLNAVQTPAAETLRVET
jgi:predicted permease